MYKMTISVPGGTMEVPGDSLEDVIKAASFLQNLPTKCHVDGSDTRLSYRSFDGFDYFGLVSTDSPQYFYPFGRPKDKTTGEFFEGKLGDDKKVHRQWTRYDYTKKENVVVWEDGKLLVNVQQGGRSNKQEAIAQDDRAPWDGGSIGGDDEVVSFANKQLGATVQASGYISPVIELRKQVRALGNELYASEWYTVSRRNVSRMTNGQYNDIDDLTAEELTRMLAGLNQLKAKAKVAA